MADQVAGSIFTNDLGAFNKGNESLGFSDLITMPLVHGHQITGSQGPRNIGTEHKRPMFDFYIKIWPINIAYIHFVLHHSFIKYTCMIREWQISLKHVWFVLKAGMKSRVSILSINIDIFTKIYT